MSIFKNEYIEITEHNNKAYIQTYQTGFQLKEFDGILRSIPRIKLTNFALLKSLLNSVSEKPIEFGQWLPSVVLEVSRDKMQASIVIYESLEFIRENKEALMRNIRLLLSEYNITHGILPFDIDHASPGKSILIAQGTPPEKGKDAVITYLELPERKSVTNNKVLLIGRSSPFPPLPITLKV